MKRPWASAVWFSCLVAPLLILLVRPAPAHGDCPPPPTDRVLSWISRTRQAAGLEALELDPVLERAAARYADELASRGVLSHRDAGGGNVLDRVQDAGGTTTLAGEILGSGPDPAEVCAAWAASGPHRTVVEGARWTHVGAGCANRGSRQIWVVVFAARRIRDLRIEAAWGGPEGGLTATGTEPPGAEGPGVEPQPPWAYRVSGRLPPREGRRPFLLSGIDAVEPALWNPDSGEFLYPLEPGSGRRYHRLGFVDTDGTVTVTDVFYPARVATSSPGTAPR